MLLKFGITGHTGSLGKILIRSKKNIKYSFFRGDVRDRKKVFDWIARNNLHAIIHLAAIVPIKDVNKDKKKAMHVNYHGTKNVVDAVAKNNIKWFFFSSSSHVYASSKNKIDENSKLNPISYYGKTKLLAEEYIVKIARKKKLNYCIGRVFSTTNVNQKKNYLVPDLKKKIKHSKKKIILNNLNHYRDFISMSDISKIILILFKKNFKGVINIATGKKIHLKKIAKIICKKYKNNNFTFTDNSNPTFIVANINKLKKICKFKPNQKIEKLLFNV